MFGNGGGEVFGLKDWGELGDVQVGVGFYAGAREVEIPELGWGEDAELFAAFWGDCGGVTMCQSELMHFLERGCCILLMWPSGDSGAVPTKNIFCSRIHGWRDSTMVS